ncbi:MAG: AMP-binding protein [Muribaculaceae bacterium]|nr:AMP-binding protein [Muribaculaceae bacterium]
MSYEEFIMSYEEFIAQWNDTTPYVPVHTSGSTGLPKEIKLPKCVMERSALRTIQYFHITPEWRLHSCISPDFIGGKMVAVRALMADCRFTYEYPSNSPVMSGRDGVIDLVSVVPSQLIYVIDRPELFRHVRRYLVGGSPLPLGMRDLITERGLKVWESYGMTETASHIAVRRVTDTDAPFEPLPGIKLSTDSRNCLIIRGATEEPVVTNDIADFSPDGRFKIVGRIDNVIISGGRKIIPEIVEDKIRIISGLTAPMILTGVPDPKWGFKPVLYIEGAPMSGAECRSMMTLLRSHLDGWECPKEIYFVDSLARTPNGKLLRNCHPNMQ